MLATAAARPAVVQPCWVFFDGHACNNSMLTVANQCCGVCSCMLAAWCCCRLCRCHCCICTANKVVLGDQGSRGRLNFSWQHVDGAAVAGAFAGMLAYFRSAVGTAVLNAPASCLNCSKPSVNSCLHKDTPAVNRLDMQHMFQMLQSRRHASTHPQNAGLHMKGWSAQHGVAVAQMRRLLTTHC